MLRINALGGMVVQRDGVRLEPVLAQPRRLALLAMLVASGERGIGRDKLLTVLWPDADEERGRKSLAQAVYSLRQAMGDDALLVSSWELRLNPELVSSDVADFTAHRLAGRLPQAAAAYHGPFLDGFNVPGSPEFIRWVEERRADLSHDYGVTLERLAAEASDPRAAAEWLKRRLALHPHDARIAAGLIQALASGGDASGALQQADAFQAALAQDLELPPDQTIEAMASRIRNGAVPPAALPSPAPILAGTAPPPSAAHPDPTLPYSPSRVPRWRAAALAGAVLLAAIPLWRWVRARQLDAAPPTLVIGRLADYRPSGAENLVQPLGDMLATSLARSPAVRVVSPARIYELLGASAAPEESAAGVLAGVARRAGASQMVDGALYALPDGRLQLDLRRVDTKTGEVLGAARAHGADLFSLVDSATASLLDDMHIAAPSGSIASLTTSSVAAYRLYSEGLRAWVSGNGETAARLFEAALAEDSNFAMAAYYSARSVSDYGVRVQGLLRAERLAARAPELERLIIRAGVGLVTSNPAVTAYADSLVVRYPEQLDGFLYAGAARHSGGRFLEALPYLERVVTVDSALPPAAGGECRTCAAVLHMIGAYTAADSIDAAIRVAQRGIRLRPSWAEGWRKLAEILVVVADRLDEARQAALQYDSLAPGMGLAAHITAQGLIRTGRSDEAVTVLESLERSATGEWRQEASWIRTIALREAGRPDEALAHAIRYRREFPGPPGNQPGAAPRHAMMQGTMLESLGRFREAAAVYDSAARWSYPGEFASVRVRFQAWALSQTASALAAAGDTSRLSRLADSIQALGSGALFGRDAGLHHHVRGLLYLARGQDSLALPAFRSAVFSRSTGFTRSGVEVARIHLRRHEPREAIAWLEPALHGSLEASNLYVSRRTIHQLLAQAWVMAGDSRRAAEHQRYLTLGRS